MSNTLKGKKWFHQWRIILQYVLQFSDLLDRTVQTKGPQILTSSLELQPLHSQLPDCNAALSFRLVSSSVFANERLTNLRPGASVADPIVIDTLTANPNVIYSEMHDQEFVQGSSGLRPIFLGHIDLCTPSPSP